MTEKTAIIDNYFIILCFYNCVKRLRSALPKKRKLFFSHFFSEKRKLGIRDGYFSHFSPKSGKSNRP